MMQIRKGRGTCFLDEVYEGWGFGGLYAFM